MSTLDTVFFYFLLGLLGICFLVLRFTPDCTPISAKQQAQLESWRKKFDEVDRRVLDILAERDFVIKYEFAEIQKRVAFLTQERARA